MREPVLTQNTAKWIAAVRGEFDAETADRLIEVIGSVLSEDSNEVVRQMTSELVIGLRDMRNLTRRIEQECSAEMRSAVLFETGIGDDRTPVTVEGFSQTMLARIAECRELLNFLTYYTMARAEQPTSPPTPGLARSPSGSKTPLRGASKATTTSGLPEGEG